MNRSAPDLPVSPLPCLAVIGGGPAGLMAAEVLAGAVGNEFRVEVFDAMPSVARKFLLAGKGGMNITHAEPGDAFLSRYGDRREALRPLLDAFGPEALRDWIHGLGITTFVGSSGRVFPADMKAAPLLRAWLHRLRAQGVVFHSRHRWLGWNESGALRFATPDGERTLAANATAATVLALGGGSWARLGSDGAWVPTLCARGVAVSALKPANCGFDVARPGGGGTGWSEHFRSRFAGQPLKTIAIAFTDAGGKAHRRRGECLLTATGVEGNLIYALSAALRDSIAAHGHAALHIDLMPDWTPERVAGEIARPRGARSLASHLQSRLGLKGARAGLLRECLPAATFADPAVLAKAIKALPLTLAATRPLDEAISSAGGVRFEALDAGLMLRALPGVFCAGEMLDWEAPTGGYLLTACFATGRAAAHGALAWLRQHAADRPG